MKLIEQIFEEVEYRIDEAWVDWKNPKHISILSEVLSELGLGVIKHELIENLIEAEEDDYSHLGAGIYVKKGDEDKENAQRFKKDGEGDSVTFKPISPDEVDKIKQQQGDAGKKAASNTPQNQQGDGEQPQEKPQGGAFKGQGGDDYKEQLPASDPASTKSSSKNSTDEDNKRITPTTPKGNPLPKNLENLFTGNAASVKNVFEYLSDVDKQQFRDFEDDYRTLVSLEDETERKNQAEKMVDKYGLDSNKGSDEPNPKLYMRKVSPDARKILCGEGNKTSEELRDTIENALGSSLKGATKGGTNVKQEVTTTSKPDIGGANKEFIRSAKEDKSVEEIFNKEPYSYLDSSMHQLMGPVGDDGNLVYPSSKHSKTYLKHSIEQNKSLEKTIEKLKQLEKSDNVKPSVRKALETHQENMNRILNEYEIPSKEASEAVGSSYAIMAETLNEESAVLAGAMMKNMAEMALYDTEIAGGDEAYLPSAGTFPSGDKIRVDRDGNGKVEKIAAVSVKYGKSGKFKAYGFPGETGQYQKFHPNPEYRDRLHSRPGDDGYDLGVKDEIVDNPLKIKEIINECGFGDAIKNQDKLIEVIQEMRTEIQTIKDNIGYIQNSAEARKAGKPTAKKQLGSQKKKISEIEKKLASKMSEYVDLDKLNELVGKDNARLIMSRPQCMITALTFGSTLNTSNGLDVIEHNHQEIADGKYISKTDTAESGETKSLKNWALTWRAYDDRAGGLIAGANAERKDL